MLFWAAPIFCSSSSLLEVVKRLNVVGSLLRRFLGDHSVPALIIGRILLPKLFRGLIIVGLERLGLKLSEVLGFGPYLIEFTLLARQSQAESDHHHVDP